MVNQETPLDLRRIRRQSYDRPGTPSDYRHVQTAAPHGIDVGWTVRLTTAASYGLEPKTATGTGVIQLDGLVVALSPSVVQVRIFWVSPAGRAAIRYRSTPVVGTVHHLSWDDLEGPAGHPPTMWLATTTETLKASARQAASAHRGIEESPTWWSEVGPDL